MLKYSRDRGLETWEVLIEEFLPPPGLSSSHSLPGHMLGILRGQLETLSSVRSPMWSVTVSPSPALHEGAEVTCRNSCRNSRELCHLPPTLVYVNPKSVFLSFRQRFLVISSSANGTGWNPPAVAGIARTHILCSHTQASCFALTSALVFCCIWHTAS